MFCRKTKLNKSLKELSFYKKRDEQQRKSNIRCKEYHHILLKDTNYMISDLLDFTNTTAIYIYKLDCPVEQWMFDLGFDLQFESFATLIGKLEFGLIIEGKAKIEKLGVIKEYRNQGFATYMMKRAIAWGKSQNLSELNLTACTSVQKLGNELNQAELVSFYYKLGFRNTFPKSNRMKYKYCGSGAETYK
ncbi:GNAT family N-acetyltransferase [Bacillus mycoides]